MMMFLWNENNLQKVGVKKLPLLLESLVTYRTLHVIHDLQDIVIQMSEEPIVKPNISESSLALFPGLPQLSPAFHTASDKSWG